MRGKEGEGKRKKGPKKKLLEKENGGRWKPLYVIVKTKKKNFFLPNFILFSIIPFLNFQHLFSKEEEEKEKEEEEEKEGKYDK